MTTQFKYNEAVLITEGAYISSMVSALTGPKVSTSAPYNYNAFVNWTEDVVGVRKILRATFVDAIPFYEPGNEISERKIDRAKKYHNFLRKHVTQNGARTKVIVGRTERINETTFKQVGVNTEIIRSLYFYHNKYAINVPVIIVSADRSLQTTIAELVHDGRDVILIGSDHPEKNLFYKDSMRQAATGFINLTAEDVMEFKDSPRWKEQKAQEKATETATTP